MLLLLTVAIHFLQASFSSGTFPRICRALRYDVIYASDNFTIQSRKNASAERMAQCLDSSDRETFLERSQREFFEERITEAHDGTHLFPSRIAI